LFPCLIVRKQQQAHGCDRPKLAESLGDNVVARLDKWLPKEKRTEQRVVRFRSADTITPKAVDWIGDKRIPAGSVGLKERNFVPDLHFVEISKDRRVYIGERGQNRIQVFTTDGKWLQDIYVSPNPPAQRGECGGLNKTPLSAPGPSLFNRESVLRPPPAPSAARRWTCHLESTSVNSTSNVSPATTVQAPVHSPNQCSARRIPRRSSPAAQYHHLPACAVLLATQPVPLRERVEFRTEIDGSSNVLGILTFPRVLWPPAAGTSVAPWVRGTIDPNCSRCIGPGT
jgi:hypothetical protein